MSSHPYKKVTVTWTLSAIRHCSISRPTNPTSRLRTKALRFLKWSLQAQRKKLVLALRHRSLLWSSILAHNHLPTLHIRERPRRITMDRNGALILLPLLLLLPTRHMRLQRQQRLLPFRTPFQIWGTTTRSLGCHLTLHSRCLMACHLVILAIRYRLSRLSRCLRLSLAPRARTAALVLDRSLPGIPMALFIMYVCHYIFLTWADKRSRSLSFHMQPTLSNNHRSSLRRLGLH